MPPTRRLKTALLLAVLATLTILYITHGPASTHNSQFYTRTVAAIQNRHDTEAREALIAEEKSRADRVARIQEEHEKAMGDAAKQKPIVDDASGSEKEKEKEKEAPAEGKPVAGRKMMPSEAGSNANGGKKVLNPNAEDDGVAHVGNTGASKARESSAAKKNNKHSEVEEEESESDHEIEVEMNTILKKGPIIIFSKSYCPFSKKAKSILLSQYTITPPPYVVELDQHPLGAGLQAALQKSTGRRTVPNILVNGKSIGGGDDVAALDAEDKLAAKLHELGGKRVMEVR